jgi:hypothetical protein
MFFHLPSFMLGYAAGLATGLVVPRLRPVAVELATSLHKFATEVAVRAAAVREDVEDLWAEACARAGRPAAPEAGSFTEQPSARA